MEIILRIAEYAGLSLFVFVVAIIILSLVFFALNIFGAAKWMAEDLARQVKNERK